MFSSIIVQASGLTFKSIPLCIGMHAHESGSTESMRSQCDRSAGPEFLGSRAEQSKEA